MSLNKAASTRSGLAKHFFPLFNVLGIYFLHAFECNAHVTGLLHLTCIYTFISRTTAYSMFWVLNKVVPCLAGLKQCPDRVGVGVSFCMTFVASNIKVIIYGLEADRLN